LLICRFHSKNNINMIYLNLSKRKSWICGNSKHHSYPCCINNWIVSLQYANTIACTERTIRSLFSSGGTDEESISRDNPVLCSKKCNIEVDFTRHQCQNPLSFPRASKETADVNARVRACDPPHVTFVPCTCQANYINVYHIHI